MIKCNSIKYNIGDKMKTVTIGQEVYYIPSYSTAGCFHFVSDNKKMYD